MRRIHPEIRQRARELRQPQTAAEQKLWSCLRNGRLAGFKFRRQHPIGSFIVDFYCASANRLVIEIDGDSHAQQLEYDEARTQWLNEHDYRVVRFTNEDTNHHLNEVLKAILAACQNPHPAARICRTLSLEGRGSERFRTLSPEGKGQGEGRKQ